MRIIDEKGRLFGRLNVIDLVVIFLVIAAVAALGIKLADSGSLGVTGATKLTYTVKVTGIEPEVYQSVLDHIPGQLMASGEMLNGTVVSVKASPSKNGASMRITDSVLDITQRDDLLDLVFTIEAYAANTVTNEIGTQEVRIGNRHIVKTDKFEMPSGVVLTCQWEEQS